MSTVQGSAIIRNYELLSQMTELNRDKDRMNKLDEIKRTRAIPIKPGKTQVTEISAEQRAEKIKDIDQHRLTWDEFCTKMNISKEVLKSGLSTDEASKRNAEFGDNQLTEKKKIPWYIKLVHEFISFFSILLWAGAVMSFIVYALSPSDPSNLYLGIVLVLIVVISGLTTFFQNAKSESIMDGFKNFIPAQSTVIRDGKEQTVLSAKLVPGDLIEMKEGQRIPADVRIISSNEMKVDNSSLTGETEPLLRSDVCSHPDKILETKNVAFFGTLCQYGKGRGVIFNIGDNTIIGQIAGLAASATTGKSTLRTELDHFIYLIATIAFGIGAVFFICGFLLRYSFLENIVFAIGIIVANVPEGMLAMITITLSISAFRLSKHQVLCKNLEAVETLGSTSCICSDKTGTLTQNRMTAEHLWYNLKTHQADNLEKKGKMFSYEWDRADHNFEELRLSAVLNTTAVFNSSLPTKEVTRLDKIKEVDVAKYSEELAKANAVWQEKLKTMPFYDREVIGDASETAIIKFFHPIEDVKEARSKFKLASQSDGAPAVVPFNSSYKFAMTCYHEQDPNSPNSYIVYLKGAPEIIWKRCKKVLRNGKDVPIDSEIQAAFALANKQYAKNGERVLGFARMCLPKDKFPDGYGFNFKEPTNPGLPEDYTFIGLISLIDPPRDTVPAAIEKCKTSGIKVIMVTGDQKLTAASIAKKIGILEDKTSLEIEEEEGCSYEEAVSKAEAIVIDGEMLTRAAAEDDGLPESEKGKKLEKWLSKPQIVFARTSPAQKLYIVKGCQKLGYITAVTGDGVNDSPAIKQAHIGIAMGITGSDVAKDAAQMILLNDDFASIVVGVEEGRKIFDNLKKSITYILASNICELAPFLGLIIFGIPLPMSTILMLLLDVGTDMYPAASFAYEKAELDIMTRPPRNVEEHLVTERLMCLAYCQIGVMECVGPFVAYFLIMHEFGMPLEVTNGITRLPYFHHNPTDIYDPNHPFLGNTNVFCDAATGVLTVSRLPSYASGFSDTGDKLEGATLDWLYQKDMYQDLRMGFLANDCGNGRAIANRNWGACLIPQISYYTRNPVCYSTEILKYSQTAYFNATIFSQFFNSWACKTRILSLISHGLDNQYMILGYALEMGSMLAVSYVRVLNFVFNTRDVIFFHAGVYTLFLSSCVMVFDEIRKYLIRNLPGPKSGKKPNYFVRNTLT